MRWFGAIALAALFTAVTCLPFSGTAPSNTAYAKNDKDKDKDKDDKGGGKGKDKDKDKDKESGKDNEGSGSSGKGKSGNSGGQDNSGPGSGGDDDENGNASGGSGQPGKAVADERAPGGHDRVVRSEIVVAEPGSGLRAFATANGFRVLHSENLAALELHVMRLEAPEGVSAAKARNLLAQRFPDAIVDFNHLYQPQTSLNLPAPDYAVKAVGWNPQLQNCAGAARLGLIDTGVDWSLPILRGAHGQSADFLASGIEAAARDHGTGIATLLVGREGVGLLPQAELYSAAIFAIDGDGRPVASATSFASALNWLMTNKVTTINVSLSGPPDRLMELAVKRAQQRGAELVAAVGNDGTTDTPRFPAAYAGVIGVTAVDYAGHVFSDANRGSFVALAAPGVDLLIPGQAAGDGDRLVSGTSFAAPYVTAALATYGNDPELMFAGARDLGEAGPDPVFGRGLVQGPGACTSAASVQ